MEISTFWLYVILQLDSLNAALGVLITLLGFSIIGLGGGVVMTEDGTQQFCRKAFKSSISAFVVLLFLIAITPTTRTAAAIAVIPAIAKSDTLAKFGDTGNALLDLANQWAKEQVKENANSDK